MDHLLELFLFVRADIQLQKSIALITSSVGKWFLEVSALLLGYRSQVSISPGPLPIFKPPSCAYQGQYLAAYLTSYIHSEKGHTFTVSFYSWNIPQHIIYDPELHNNNSQHDNVHIHKLVPAYSKVSRKPPQDIG